MTLMSASGVLGWPMEGDMHKGHYCSEVVLQAVHRHLSCGLLINWF